MTVQEGSRNTSRVWLAVAVVAAAIFILDTYTPLGIAVPMLYVIPILLTWLEPNSRITAIMAVCSFVLTGLGIVFSPGEFTTAVAADRVMAAALLSVVAWLMIKQKRLIRRAEENQELLRASEARWQATFDISSIGMCKVEASTNRLLRVNQCFREMLGYSETELVNLQFSEIIHPGDRETNVQGFRRLICGDAAEHRGTHRYVRKDGTVMWGEITVNLIRNAEGQPWRLVAAIHDVTKLKRAEDELCQSEGRFRAFVTASSDVAYRMSPDWSEIYQFDSRNVFSKAESPSRTWLQKYIHPDDQAEVMVAIKEAIRTKSLFELEHQVLRGDGSLCWMFTRAIPTLDSNGNIVEWIGMTSDSTIPLPGIRSGKHFVS